MAQLGDARLTQRLVQPSRELAHSPQCSFPPAPRGPQLSAVHRFSTMIRWTPRICSAPIFRKCSRVCRPCQ
ncbi:transposase DNA-binding-containing protein [Caballeronia mineralivorans]|uniref:transposase DNA-binding-containing protein n=1 Tax=Caballeronia mineralivorans TaxID=2010198 RepID=UPI00389915E8